MRRRQCPSSASWSCMHRFWLCSQVEFVNLVTLAAKELVLQEARKSIILNSTSRKGDQLLCVPCVPRFDR